MRLSCFGGQPIIKIGEDSAVQYVIGSIIVGDVFWFREKIDKNMHVYKFVIDHLFAVIVENALKLMEQIAKLAEMCDTYSEEHVKTMLSYAIKKQLV